MGESFRMVPENKAQRRITDMQMFVSVAAKGDGLFFSTYYFEDSKLTVPQWMLKKGTAAALPVSLWEQVVAGRKYPDSNLDKMIERYGIQGRPKGAVEEEEEEAPKQEEGHSYTWWLFVIGYCIALLAYCGPF